MAGRETLADASEKVVNKLLNRVSSKKRTQGTAKLWDARTNRNEEGTPECGAPATLERAQHEESLARQKVDERNVAEKTTERTGDVAEDEDDVDWEEGAPAESETAVSNAGLTIEVEKPSVEKKTRSGRRANAKDKEFSELVHKAHLLCMLARGRLVDAACDDPFLRASLMSLLPLRLSSLDPEEASLSSIASLTRWLHATFRTTEEHTIQPVPESLTQAISQQSGSEEVLAAVAVTLFRALGFKTRYVTVLDVTSIKPDSESLVASKSWGLDEQYQARLIMETMFPTSVIPERPKQSPPFTKVVQQSACSTSNVSFEQSPGPSETPKTQATGKKRKGDEEFELEMARAMAATEAQAVQKKVTPQSASKRTRSSSSSKAFELKSTPTPAVWSRKKGPLLHWAEVYSGEDGTGRWCHVDAARSLVDDAEKIEAASKHPVRYVVAFAGSGVKDVTLRYVTSWSKLAGLRVDQSWWDACISPLRRMEENAYPVSKSSNYQERNAREDMELQVKSITEPLPTNQQAYRNHHLYAMERWLTRYQILHPKGPVLGHCGGHPVYPRTCVQDLHTRERWLREGFAVRAGEEPVKKLKPRHKQQSPSGKIDIDEEVGSESEVLLFGKWQTDPWEPPPAVNGLVPKNERGQVDVWSEKCIPAGAVHLKMPRLGAIAQRLGVDFAPAMVGFEIRQGRSVPVFQGIVVCEEFKPAILEVFRAEEEQRAAELERKREQQAGLRWRQLLRSMLTRERLRAAYETATPAAAGVTPAEMIRNVDEAPVVAGNQAMDDDHVHTFTQELQRLDTEDSSKITVKRCACGFEIRVEEM